MSVCAGSAASITGRAGDSLNPAAVCGAGTAVRRHSPSRQFCGFSLHAGHDVGVLAEGEAWAFMAEAFADDLDRHVRTEGDRGMSVPQVMIMPTSA
jgi:hypothetical protein